MQELVPAENSLVSLMLRAKNKETGQGLTDKQIVSQSNTFIAAGMLLSPTSYTSLCSLNSRSAP